MLAETSKLYVEMAYRDAGFKAAMAGASRSTKTLGLDMSKLQGGLSKVKTGLTTALKVGAVVGGAAIGFLTVNVLKGIKSLAELQKVTAATEAVIKSTGGTAGLTTQAIRDMSSALEDLTTIDDKTIQGGANLLLTFTNVRKKAFEPALLAALNLSTAMGTNLNGSIVQIGKALNDPIKGITALTRVGVTFTEGQKKQIANLVKHNKLFEAQKIILDELNKEFGGQAAAAANTYDGAMRRLGDSVETLQQSLAEALVPAITKVSTKLATILKDPAVIQKVKDLGNAIAGLVSDENIDKGVDGVKKFFGFLADLPWSDIKNGISVSTRAAGEAVKLFRSLPPELQTGLIGLLAVNKLSGGLVASGIGDLLKFTLGSLKTIYAGNVTVVGANVGGGGVPGVPVAPGSVPSNVGTLVNTVGKVAIVGTVATGIVSGLAVVSDILYQNQGYSQEQITELQRASSMMNTQQALYKRGYFEQAAALQTQIDLIRANVGKPLANIDTNTTPMAANTEKNAATLSHISDIAASISSQAARDKTVQDQTQRIQDQGDKMTRLQMRLNGAVMVGDDKRAARLQGKINQLVASTHATTTAIRNKDLSLRLNNFFSPRFTVSGTAIATVVQSVVARNRFIAS